MNSERAFGFTVNVHFGLGAENVGRFANMYRYDRETNRLVYIGSFRINEDGQAMFGITQGGTFVVTITDERPNEVGGDYTVQSGDSLSRIARRHGMKLSDLLACNPQITDPNRIQVGQTINLH